MKKRNVLFSLFGVSLLASVLLAGCSGLANPLKKAKVTFDPSRVSCTLAQGGNSEIKSGAMVAENTALYFKAALPADKTVGAWMVNGKEKGTAESFLYYVNLKELNLKDGAEITVSFTEQDAQMVPVTFDKEKVLAYKVVEGSSTDGTSIDSGTSYKRGSQINFVAKPTKGMVVDHWTVNGNIPQHGASNGSYTHIIGSMDEKTVAVAFTEKEAQVVVTFDEAKVTCMQGSNKYSSGKAFPLGTTLDFTANLDTGKTVANWYVSEKKQEVEGNSAYYQFRYTIDARDIKDTEGKKGIAIKYEVTDEEKVAVKFDEAKIYCVKASGEKWADGTELTFYARLADNESVKAWMVNGINGRDITHMANPGRSSVTYRVSLNDAKDNDGVIEISYTTVTTTVKVNFDKNAIFCKEVSGKEWSAGKSFDFKAKVPAGEVLEGWYVNGKDQYTNNNTFFYEVKTDDAKDGVIEVTRKLYDKVKITFDKTKVQVTKDGKELDSGALCAEGDTLQLTAKIDTANDTVDKWLINGFKDSTLSGDAVPYLVYNRNAKTEGKDKVISIGLESKKRPAATETTITVNFDKAKMSCTRFDSMTYTTVAVEPGTKLDRYTNLTFTATLQAGEEVAAWRVNGVKQYSVGSTYYYQLREDDLEGGVRTVEITYDKK